MASAPESSNVIVSKDFSALTDDLVFQISSLVCRSAYIALYSYTRSIYESALRVTVMLTAISTSQLGL